MDGVINIYKEKGYTSHDVVAVVRKIFNMKRVGHTGTLDPDAEGVLPICIGKATKLSDYIMSGKKSYRTVLKLGISTTTDDASGEVLEVKEVEADKQKILETILSFKGEIEQIPPMYSAVKVNGKKLYELAREGKEIERKTRKITIYDIKNIEFLEFDCVKMEIFCSKGTYIRSLCADIGKKIGCGGHMKELVRTSSGNFDIKDSIKLDDLKKLKESGNEEKAVIGLKEILKDFNWAYIAEKGNKILYNGGRIYEFFVSETKFPLTQGDLTVCLDFEGNIVGLYSVKFDSAKELLCLVPAAMLIG